MSRNITNIRILLAITVAAGLVSCSEEEKEAPTPLRLFIGYDCSISADENNVPQLTPATLDSLINIVARRGGSVNFLPFTSNSNQPVMRLQLNWFGDKTLEERATLAELQRAHIRNFKTLVQSSVGMEAGSSSQLLRQLRNKREEGRRAERTDIWGAIRRFNMVLQEPYVGTPTQDVGLLITDGIDDAKLFPPSELQTQHIFTVGMESKKAVEVFGSGALAFESLASALAILQNLPANVENFPQPVTTDYSF
jgi:hypothetical protein